jgi:uncharacterized protein (TIGR00730 family)
VARRLGAEIAGRGIGLVYGGGGLGLMGVVADGALSRGGRVTGVIPRDLFSREMPHKGLTDLVEVSSLHERKQMMFELSDAFVALPGGLGTLEELTEMATWSQLGLHRKPIATLDVAGYWRPFHAMLENAVRQGFLKAESLGIVLDVKEVEDLFPALESYSSSERPKWIGIGET